MVKCAACGSDISPQAQSCPRCGHPQAAADRQKFKQAMVGCGFGIAVLVALTLVLGKACENAMHG